MDAAERGALGGIFDDVMRSLNVPDVIQTKATTVRSTTPIKELSQTWIVQTFRHRERGDYVTIEYVGADGTVRIALPPAVADTISRQRDALTSANRKRAARQRAAADKAAGVVPGFMRKKAKKPASK